MYSWSSSVRKRARVGGVAFEDFHQAERAARELAAAESCEFLFSALEYREPTAIPIARSSGVHLASP